MTRFVAVSADRRPLSPARAGPRVRPPRPEVFLGEALVGALRRAGLEPLLLPPRAGDPDGFAADLLDRVSALVIAGGAFDIHPRRYGAEVHARLDATDDGRTDLELGLCRAALARDLPVLGICGGMQALAVAAGGTLVQDIRSADPAALEHEQPTDPATPWHPVAFADGPLREALGPQAQVNSTHHQAVDRAGALRACGRSPDGSVESVHLPGRAFVVGVQWHPELLDDPRLFAAFAAAAR
jgi:putative glutamine amidotransferase